MVDTCGMVVHPTLFRDEDAYDIVPFHMIKVVSNSMEDEVDIDHDTLAEQETD